MDQTAGIKRWFQDLRRRVPLPRWLQEQGENRGQTTATENTYSYIIPTRSKLPRERALIIAETNVDLATHNQMQSPLFAKLPFELRCMIYRETLGGWVLMLDRIGRAM